MGGDPLKRPEELIRRVYSYVAYRIGDGPEAEDVTSDVVERALRYRERYDPLKGSPQAWVLGIARSCVADYFAARLAPEGDVQDIASSQDLEHEAVERLTLQEAVGQLDDRDRDLLALRYGGDLKAREIADLLGERPNTVEVALHRAIARLRRRLEGNPSSGAPVRKHTASSVEVADTGEG
jgi:RNA polymerase sigma-70 factor, ECF subfamily